MSSHSSGYYRHHSDSQQEGVFVKTLLITDLVNSTKLVEELGDTRASEVFARHDRLARDLLEQFDGREIDKSDGFLMMFDRPVDAVRFSLTYHSLLTVLSSEMGVTLASRLGIHLGEVILSRTKEEDIRRGAKALEVKGIAVPMAARVMSCALGGQSLLTKSAFDLARRAAIDDEALNPRIRWLAHGPYVFKGVDEEIEICEVGVEGLAPLKPPPNSEKVKRAVKSEDDFVVGWRPAKDQEILSRPHWVLKEKMGDGMFGEMWIAVHRKTSVKHVFKFCFDPEKMRILKREVALFRLLKESLGERDDINQLVDWQFDEQPYYLEAEYTVGGNLTEWAAAQGGVEKVPVGTRLEIVAKIADALSAAHGVGILHKDIKPSNILMTTGKDGKPKAVLTDFGIGMVLDRTLLQDKNITATGLTNPSSSHPEQTHGRNQMYMAPELLEGKMATTVSDIYALGVILYQLVSGDLTRALASGWERDIDDEFIRQDIAACVEGRPSRRLTHAAELAKRIRSVDSRRLEHTQRVESDKAASEEAEKLRIAQEVARQEAEQARKRRKVFTIISVAGLIVSAMVLYLAVRAQQAQKIADEKAAEAQRTLYLANVLSADSYLSSNQLSSARSVLWKTPIELRDWEWGYLVRQSHLVLNRLQGHTRELVGAVFSPDGKLIVTASKDGTAIVWDAVTGQKQRSFDGHKGPINDVDMSPAGRVVTASNDKNARIWDIATGKEIASLLGHEDAVTRCHFNPDGSQVVTTSKDGKAIVWDAARGLRLATLANEDAAVSDAAFTPDGKNVLTGDASGKAILWETLTGGRLQTYDADKAQLIDVEISPDGKMVAAVSPTEAGELFIWEADSGKRVQRIPAWGFARFSPDGTRILSALGSNEAGIWDVHTGERLVRLTGHNDQLLNASFSVDGLLVVTTSLDESARLWNSRTGVQLAVLAEHADRTVSAEFGFNARRLVTASDDNTAIIWDMTAVRGYGSLTESMIPIVTAQPNNSGTHMVVSSWNGSSIVYDLRSSVKLAEVVPFQLSHENRRRITEGNRTLDVSSGQLALLDTESGTELELLRDSSWLGHRADVSSNGELVAVAGILTPHVYTVADGKEVAALKGHEDLVIAIRFSPDGNRIVTTSRDNTARVWNSRTGDQISTFVGHGKRITSVVFNSNGGKILTASEEGTASVWEAGTGKELFSLSGHNGAVLFAAYNNANTQIVTGSQDGKARLWNAEKGGDPLVLNCEDDPVTCGSFDPSGEHLITGCASGLVRIWGTKTGMIEKELPTPHTRPVVTAMFSPTGTRALTASQDRTAKIWDWNGQQEMLALRGHTRGLYGAVFTPDGSTIITTCQDGFPRNFEAAPWLSKDLPGDTGLRWEQRLELWQRER